LAGGTFTYTVNGFEPVNRITSAIDAAYRAGPVIGDTYEGGVMDAYMAFVNLWMGGGVDSLPVPPGCPGGDITPPPPPGDGGTGDGATGDGGTGGDGSSGGDQDDSQDDDDVPEYPLGVTVWPVHPHGQIIRWEIEGPVSISPDPENSAPEFGYHAFTLKPTDRNWSGWVVIRAIVSCGTAVAYSTPCSLQYHAGCNNEPRSIVVDTVVGDGHRQAGQKTAYLLENESVPVKAVPTVTDGEGNPVSVGLTYHWDWEPKDPPSNGGSAVQPSVEPVGGQDSQTATFRFNRPGTYSVGCWASDGEGNFSTSPSAWMAVQVGRIDLAVDSNNDGWVSSSGDYRWNDDLVEEDSPGLILHVNNDNDDLEQELSQEGVEPETDNENSRIDGPQDMSDLQPLILLLPFPPNLLGQGSVTIEKASGTGQVRVFLDDGESGEMVLGPDSEGGSRDLWPDLQVGQLTLLVEGVKPGPVTLEVSYAAGDLTSQDNVRLSVVDIQPPSSIYQLEVLNGLWSLGKVSGSDVEAFGDEDRQAILNKLAYSVTSGSDSLIILDSEIDGLIPARASAAAPVSSTLYDCKPSFRALGKAQEFDWVELALHVKSGTLSRKVWETGLVAIPLTMSQRVIPPDIGFAGPGGLKYVDRDLTHACGLLGHVGVFEAKPENNYQMTGRDIRFTRAGLTWSHAPVSDAILNSVVVRNGGESVGDNPAAVKIYGARPGFSSLQVHANVGGESILVGQWEVQCHTPVLLTPHPGQMNLDGTASDSPIGDFRFRLTAPHSGLQASRSVHMLEAQIQRARLIVGQLVDPEEGMYDRSIFSWAIDESLGFTYRQAESLLNGGAFVPLPKHRQLNLIHRYTQYSWDAGGSRGNGDMYAYFKTLARQYVDSGCQNRLIQGVSIEVDPENYIPHVRWRTGLDQAPSRNHYRSQWDTSALTLNGTRRSLEALFRDAGANTWSVQHPFTVTGIKAMVAQRIDLGRHLGQLVGQRYDTEACRSIRNMPPPMRAFEDTGVTFQVNYSYNPRVRVRICPDLSWETEWFEEKSLLVATGNLMRYAGPDILNPRKARDEKYSIEMHERLGYIQLAEDAAWLFDPEYTGPSSHNDFSRIDEYLFVLTVKEIDALQDVLANLGDIRAWEQYRNVFGEVGVSFLWIGTTVGPVGDVYESAFGRGFLDDRELGLGERLLSGTFAAVDVVPFAVSVSKMVTPVMRGAAGSLAKRTVGAALQGVSGADNILRFAAKVNDCADFDIGSYASKTLRNTTSKVLARVPGLARYADEVAQLADEAAELEERLLKGQFVSLGDDVKAVAQTGHQADGLVLGVDIRKQGDHIVRKMDDSISRSHYIDETVAYRGKARRAAAEVAGDPSIAIDNLDDLMTVAADPPPTDAVRRFSGPSPSTYSDAAQGSLDDIIYRPTSTGTTRLPAGWGETNKWGDIWYSTGGSMTDQMLARNHEYVHSILSPKIRPFRELRANLRKSLYERSPLLRGLEEAIAETAAQLSVRGISLRNILNGVQFPVKEGYIILARDGQALLRDAVVGTITVGGVSYTVYIAATSQ
jgi:hypothetical protein